MKKPVILIAAIAMTAISVFAQNEKPTNAKVLHQFHEAFPGVTNVAWTSMANQVSKAQFLYDGQSRMAFYDSKGMLISSGRKIKNLESLPIQISAALEQKKAKLEKKHGPLLVAHTYEMITGETTKYYSTLGNEHILTILSIAPNGYCVVERTDRRPNVETIQQAPRDIIAKKN